MSDIDRTRSVEVHVPPGDEGPERLRLAIAWSSHQPELVGYTASVSGPGLLGRGAEAADDPRPRLAFFAQRPGKSDRGPPLAGAELSRRQLLIEPVGDDAVAVKSIGRLALLHDGQPVTEAIARPGDTLCLAPSLVLLVVARPLSWVEAHRHWTHIPFAFGAPDAHGIVGEHPAMWKLRDAVGFAAQSSQHVLVRGESGSGKELVARALHALSARSRGPFVARNAATLPEGLVDAELFGSVRGYPHATSPERPGLIGQADGGTLFLDEIAELAHDLQAHLLRVLDQGGEYQRLGDARVRRADVRLVAATNRPIESLKHDLAARFRLHLAVPGLNERREDIPLLLRLLFARAVREHPRLAAVYGGRDAVQLGTALDPALVEALLRHRYTHHLRELDQLLWLSLSSSPPGRVELTRAVRAQLDAARARAEAAVVTAGAAGAGAVVAGAGAVAGPATVAAGVSQLRTERETIEAALAQTGGKVAPAARLLGLGSRHALYRLMEKHGIRRAAGPGDDADE